MRRDFWAVAASISVIVVGANAPIPLFTLYQDLWHFSTGMLTVIYGAYTVGVLAAIFLIAPLSDQIGRKRLLLPAIAAMTVALILCATAQNVLVLILGRVLQGLAIGAGTTTAMAALGELADGPDAHDKAALVATLATVVGLAGGPLVAGLLAEYGPYPLILPYAFICVFTALSFISVARMNETVTRSTQVTLRPRTIHVPPDVRPAFWVATYVESTAYAVAGTFAGLGAAFTRDLLHVGSHAAAGLLVALLFVASTASQLAFRKLRPVGAMLTGLGVLSLGLGFLIAAIVTASPGLFFGATVGLGVGHGLAYFGSQELLDTVAPASMRAQIIAGFLVGLYVGATIPAVAVGFVSRTFGLALSTLWFAGIVVLMCLVGIAWVARFNHSSLLIGKGTQRA